MTLADDKFSMTGEEDLGTMYKMKAIDLDNLVEYVNNFYEGFERDENVIFKIEYERLFKENNEYIYICRMRKFERFKHVDSRELREHYQQKKLK